MDNLLTVDLFHAIWHGNFIYFPPCITKDLLIFIDFCCWFGWIICEILFFSMQFGMETLFTFLLYH